VCIHIHLNTRNNGKAAFAAGNLARVYIYSMRVFIHLITITNGVAALAAGDSLEYI